MVGLNQLVLNRVQEKDRGASQELTTTTLIETVTLTSEAVYQPRLGW